jgi:hypothetical protein
MSKSKKISVERRNFLKVASTGIAGIALSSGIAPVFATTTAVTSPGPGNKWPGRVVINFNKNAPGDKSTDATTAQVTIIKTMVDDSIKLLTGQTTVGAAWKAVFPSTLTATSKIAIKIPLLNPGLPAPHWSSVQAITEGLIQMDFSGTTFPAANITIYDMNNSSTMATAGFTAARFPGVNLVKDSTSSYGDGAKNIAGTVEPYATTLNAAAFLINVFSPRGHSSYAGNFTLGFKNHYGTYPTAYHDSNTQGFLRNINCTGPVYNKTVLCICSGMYGMNESNGPTGSSDNYSTYSKTMDSISTNNTPTTIIMSTDPISCEMQAVKMMRINNSGKYTTSDMPNYLKSSGGVSVSGYTPINNIGTIDESAMTILKILNGTSTPVLQSANKTASSSKVNIVAHQLSGGNSTYIEFMLPENRAGKDAFVEIYDINGKLVRNVTHRISGVRNHLSWDETDTHGSRVSAGTYIIRLVSEANRVSTQCSIIR